MLKGKNSRKILALLVSLVMVLGLSSAMAFADTPASTAVGVLTVNVVDGTQTTTQTFTDTELATMSQQHQDLVTYSSFDKLPAWRETAVTNKIPVSVFFSAVTDTNKIGDITFESNAGKHKTATISYASLTAVRVAYPVKVLSWKN